MTRRGGEPKCGEAVLAVYDIGARIDKQEAARSVGILRFTLSKAKMTDQCRLLIAQTLMQRSKLLESESGVKNPCRAKYRGDGHSG